MKTAQKIQVVLLLLFLTSTSYAQKIQKDSIDLTNYKNISDEYYKAAQKNNTKRANYFANIYLKKAKKEDQNTLQHIYGHYFKHEVSEFKNAILHLDSIIEISNYLKEDPTYPDYAYFLKGGLYYDQKDFKNALDNYLFALDIAEKKNNQYMVAVCKNSIGLLKSERIGQERDALNLLKQSLKFYDTIQDKSDYSYDYSALLFSISENYRKLNELDSSTYFHKKGLAFSKEYNEETMYSYFIYAEGVGLFTKGYPKIAINNIEKSLPKLDISNSIIAHYYLSKSYEEIGNFEKKMEHLKKLDSIQQGQPIYLVELRNGLEDLIDYYKEVGDLEKQLIYIKRLISLDSIYINDYKAIVQTINVKYDNKNLTNEKQVLIQRLNSAMSSSKKLTYIITFLLIVIVTIYYYFYEKQKKLKKLFEEIIAKEEYKTKNIIKKRKEIDISEEVIDSVLEKLDHFESNKGYLKQNITTYELSKTLNTNDKYLSKIINHTKGKGIILYINDLRVEYAIDKLRRDPYFNKYTIKAIAEEVGFSNTRSFNKAFKSVTKMKPSSFLEELKNRSVNSTN